MLRRAIHGLIAGAAGSATLNVITFLDMLGRTRPSSSVPADTALAIAESAGTPQSWMADIVPHLGYGPATVAVYRTPRG